MSWGRVLNSAHWDTVSAHQCTRRVTQNLPPAPCKGDMEHGSMAPDHSAIPMLFSMSGTEFIHQRWSQVSVSDISDSKRRRDRKPTSSKSFSFEFPWSKNTYAAKASSSRQSSPIQPLQHNTSTGGPQRNKQRPPADESPFE